MADRPMACKQVVSKQTQSLVPSELRQSLFVLLHMVGDLISPMWGTSEQFVVLAFQRMIVPFKQTQWNDWARPPRISGSGEVSVFSFHSA